MMTLNRNCWLFLMLLPTLAAADAEIQEWIGAYTMNHDGHVGILRIVDSKADCVTSPWCNLSASYENSDGEELRVQIGVVDQAFQHMQFFVAFPGERQRFDGYLMSFDKTKMAGITNWRNQSFGFYATKLTTPTIPPRNFVFPNNQVLNPNDLRNRIVVDVPAANLTSVEGATIRPDGSVQRLLPNGMIEIQRPGECGSIVIDPESGARVGGTACYEVPFDNPPSPPGPILAFLEPHAERLLSIILRLVDDNQAAVNNYLNNFEDDDPTIYDRIRLRADMIRLLTSP